MVFTQEGNFQYLIFIQCLNDLLESKGIPPNPTIPNYELACIEWFSGGKSMENNQTGLIIAYKVGRFQLMKSETDSTPVNIDAGITINEVKWNPKGEIFAVSGILNTEGEAPLGVVQFYDYSGTYIRVLKIDKSDSVGALTWNGDGLKLALGVNFSMYLASCKLNYKMCYLATSKVFVFAIEKENRIDSCVVFYDTKRKTFKSKFLRHLVQIIGFEDHCALVGASEEEEGVHHIMLCNSLGTTVENKFINFEPLHISMNKIFVIIGSHEHVYVWQYRVSNRSSLESDMKKMGRETAFSLNEEPNPKKVYNYETYEVNQEAEHIDSLQETIANINCTHNSFIVATTSGRARRFNLPYLNLDSELAFNGKPLQVFSNKDGNKLAVIDTDNVLSFYTKEPEADLEKIDYEKKEVWSFMWSRDSNDQCCFLDKYRLNVMVNWTVTHLINIDNYLCDFNEMKILTVDIEKIINSFDSENPSGIVKCFFESEIPPLVEVKKMLTDRQYEDSFKKVAQYNQPYLWEITAQQCLLNLDFDAAERAFVEYNSYGGLKFTQKLQSMENKLLQKAEIYAFFQQFEDSRNLLLKAERKDLALQLMTKTGDYQGLEHAISRGDWDSGLLNRSHKILGNYYKDCLNWKKASHYYALCDDQEALVECYYMAKNSEKLGKLVYQINDKDMLLNIGEKLESLNSIEMAAKAYEKIGDPKKGVDVAIINNYWGVAVEIAERNNMVQIDGLISKYAKMLLDKNRKLEAIELFRKANRNPEAASMLNSLAKELIERNLSPLLIKKLFVLAGLEVTNFQKRIHDMTLTGMTGSTQRTLDTLITSDINTGVDKALTNPWRGAEAWHFLILAHKMLYGKNFKQALQTAIRLQEYELELDPKRVYSVIAVTSYFAGHFKECSTAIMKLEALPNLTAEDKKRYEHMALSIFKDRNPAPPEDMSVFKCPATGCDAEINDYSIGCTSCGSNFQSCVASGKPILVRDYYKCTVCKHKTLMESIRLLNIKHCVLCHNKLDPSKLNEKNNSQPK